MTLHERLEEIFRTVFHDEELVLRDLTGVADIPEWDSVAHINLMFSIEQAFGVQFMGSEMGEMQTVGEIKARLSERLTRRRVA